MLDTVYVGAGNDYVDLYIKFDRDIPCVGGATREVTIQLKRAECQSIVEALGKGEQVPYRCEFHGDVGYILEAQIVVLKK